MHLPACRAGQLLPWLWLCFFLCARPAVALGAQPTNISLALTSGAPIYGVTLQISATVTPAAPGATQPTGLVTFLVDGFSTTFFPLGSTGVATIPLSFLTGNHSIGASYSGDANFLASVTAVPLSLQIAKAGTSIAMASNPPQIDQPVAIRAAVTLAAGNGSAGGTVDFNNAGAGPIPGCTALPAASGVAICNTTFTAVGAVTVTASYSGNNNTTASEGSLALNIGKVLAGVYIAAAPDAPSYGSPVTVNALLIGAQGVPAPTGTVTFSDRATVLGTRPVGADGRASLVTPFAVGTYIIDAAYAGDANYQPSATRTPLSLVVGKAATTLALASTPAQIAQPVTIRAVVSLAGSGAPAGTVDFTAAARPIDGCSRMPLQNGAATCNARFAQLGAYTIGAGYSGDGNTAASTATMQLTVGKVVAGVYLESTPAAPVFGVPVSVDALVLSAEGAPPATGSVIFSEGGANLGTLPLGADGRASLVLRLNAGSHNIGAIYGGDGNYQSSTASAHAVAVARAGTTTWLTAPPGGPLVATVTVDSPGAGTPAGAVQFLRGGAVIGSAPLLAQGGGFTATLSWQQTGIVNAVYQGDANFNGSTSAPATATQPQPPVIVTSDRNPARPGETVTFTVTVSPPSSAFALIPTGAVTLSADGSSVGTAALSAGQATFRTSFAIGAHNILAQYSGDATYAPANGASTETVSAAAASLSVASSQPVAYFGQPVVFTARLASAAGGTVRFSEGPAVVGSAPLSEGVAQLTVADLPAGSHAITASWSGDANWGAAAAQFVQVVGRTFTTTVCSLSGGVLRATVTAVAPGGGSPGGTVRFVDAGTSAVLASALLDSGRASAVLASAGGSIVAVYPGDANFLGSMSAPLSPLAAVNAASYASSGIAPDEIVTLFGPNLATETASAVSQPAASLGGVTVSVADSAGVSRTAPLLFVSPAQATILVPPDLAPGAATITAARSNGAPLSTAITVARAAPGLFTADGTGEGTPAAQLIRIHADGTRDAAEAVAASAPIDVGDPGDSVYLVLYGTGIRHFTTAPTCAIAGQAATVAFAGAQESFPGLDQVNVLLPAALGGAGRVKLTLTVDGIESNAVTVVFR